MDYTLAEDTLKRIHHYTTPGVLPPSARVDPNDKLQLRRPLRLWEYWKYGIFIAEKTSQLTGDILSHHLRGPRRKTWGLDMTIFNSLARGASRHSSLIGIDTVRMVTNIAQFIPLPADALVTPVSFRVEKRNLRGFLAQYDENEKGRRELTGEWVVGKHTWQRLQAEWKAAEISGTRTARKKDKSSSIFMVVRAYYLGNATAMRIISIPLSKATGCRVFALNYRLAPETRFPGSLHDAVVAYLRLVNDLDIPPENIIVCGDSAGGGLSLALLMYLRDNKYSLPSAAILFSPWVDLTMSCDSWDTNAMFDILSLPTGDNHMNPVGLYLGDNVEQYITHPYASPLFGDYHGLPDLLIHAGDAEVLRDEISLLAHKALSAGVNVQYELFDDSIHVFQMYPFLNATRRSFESIRHFLAQVLHTS
ncbi:Alpha/Beta hydrolase protein [Cyathus striatus]|nr:Alpha/Beta hydrolase protein [Cyathus striatus]